MTTVEAALGTGLVDTDDEKQRYRVWYHVARAVCYDISAADAEEAKAQAYIYGEHVDGRGGILDVLPVDVERLSTRSTPSRSPTQSKEPLVADEKLYGRLANVRPLDEAERKRLFDSLSSERDKQEFTRIAGRHKIEPPPDVDYQGHLLSHEARAMWQFGQEFERRAEAQELRQFVQRTQTRAQTQTQQRRRDR